MIFSRYCQYAFLLSFCSLRLVSLYWSVFFLHGCCFIFLKYSFLLVVRDFISLFIQGSLRLELFIIFVGIDWFIMSKTFSLKLFHSWSTVTHYEYESMVHGQAFRIITWQPAKRMSYYIMTIFRFSRFISHLLLINLSPFRLTRKRLNERCCNLVKHDFFHGMLQFRGRKHDSFSVLIFSSDNLRCTPCGLTRIIQSLYYAPAGRFIN
jgi:hypothetical protein